jgi:hypothetical protein
LRTARADAVARDDLNKKIDAKTTERNALADFSSSDPGAEGAAQIAATFGLGEVKPALVKTIRIAGLTIMPAIGSIVLAIAFSLFQPPTPKWPRRPASLIVRVIRALRRTKAARA